MPESTMPQVDLEVIRDIIQAATGRKFKKNINVLNIQDAAFVPDLNLIIIDVLPNSNRRDYYDTLIHEMLHKLNSETDLKLTHEQIYALQVRLYGAVEKTWRSE